MAISKAGDTYLIQNQPQLTDATMGALIQFLDLVPDIAGLHLLVNNLTFHAIKRDPEHIDDWQGDYAAMNALQLFLAALTRHQEPEGAPENIT